MRQPQDMARARQTVPQKEENQSNRSYFVRAESRDRSRIHDPRKRPHLHFMTAKSPALYARNRTDHTAAAPQFQSDASIMTSRAVPPATQPGRGDVNARILPMRACGLRLTLVSGISSTIGDVAERLKALVC